MSNSNTFIHVNKISFVSSYLSNLYSRFIKYARALGQKWGRAQRRAVSKWYTEQDPGKLAMAVTKYQTRESYSHRDILRLAHPTTKDPLICFLFDYITHGFQKAIENLNKPKATTNDDINAATLTDKDEKQQQQQVLNTVNKNKDDDDEEVNNKKPLTIEQLKDFIKTVERVKKSTSADELVAAIQQHNLVREHMPTDMLNSVPVWSALLEKMPLTAMIRNLG